MDNKPSFSRDLIIPIVVGGISIVGILGVFLVGRALNSPPQVPMTPSATPFKYIYLGTEPAITTLLVEDSQTVPVPEDPFGGTLGPIPPTLDAGSTVLPPFPPFLVTTSVSPPLILRTSTSGGLPGLPPTPTRTASFGGLPTPTRTTSSGGLPTATRTAAVGGTPTATRTQGTTCVPNTYDDTSPQLAYTGNWVSQNNVSGAYQDTLHVSNTVGDTVSFTFTGNEIHLCYQAGPSLGTVAITIDNVGPPPLSQAQNATEIKEWEYNLDTSGTHAIVIQHFGGGSVNIDALAAPGGTPTATPTQ